MAKDYYDILGVAKGASTDEIKRAYRKLAHQHHPDKGGDSEKFKEINEAYQTLSDSQKRQQYDTFGSAGNFSEGFSGQGGPAEGWDFGDIFGNARSSQSSGGFSFNFGGFGDIFEDIFENNFSQIQTQVEISLTQALLGDILHLQTSDRERIDLEIPAGTLDGTTFKMRGKGGQSRRGRGDLLITVKIKFPRKLSRRQRELLEELKREGL
ncbi:MAG: molecular chaperone DnaJ [Candidatus Berkelbacteria bacterium Licking1014_85]|uniref:Molecular chaperone DnaJ n=1 Tax=Candidatus Berkelbacteria bacterium Licking1014_85 TaxID=2017148 RepID=A0A554LHM3_9BACT|nr:MAG: molecular chaperone DnaJ [Candidatus Berkelbacteria bacterium Licking1014_85]